MFTILETFGSKSGCKVDLNRFCAFYLGKSKYTRLITAIPTEWIQNLSLTSNFDCFKNNATQIVFTWTSCKKAYCLLIENIKILPRKQQNKQCEKLQIKADSLN